MSRNFHATAKIDSCIDEDNPKQNSGGQRTLSLCGKTNETQYALLFFPLPKHIRRYTILTATLELHEKSSDFAGTTITAKRISQTWNEGDVSWNNQPNASGTNQASCSGDGVGGKDEIDVSDMLEDVADGDKYYGIRLEISGDNDTHKLHSSECNDKGDRPQLHLVYAGAPDAPTDLTPNGIAIYDSQPVLRWHMGHKPLDGTQAHSRVQVTGAGDPEFASPEYDSLQQDNEKGMWDLAAATDPTFDPIPDEGKRLWRVKVWADVGTDSPWSDTAEFGYDSAGTVLITAPVTDDDPVNDTTPPIVWTFTPGGDGNDQTMRKAVLSLADGAGGWTRLATTGWEKTAVKDWTPDEGFIKKNGSQYRVEVFVIDGKDSHDYGRSPEDADTPKDTRTFYFVNDDTVDPPDTLSADVVGAGIDLAWYRLECPDKWGIIVDGELINTLDGPDCYDGEGHYSWTWYGARPNETYDIQVKAKIVGDGSPGTGWSHPSNTETVVFTVLGIYLIYMPDQIIIPIYGDMAMDETLSRDGETFYLVNRRDPVRIEGLPRGMYGHVDGQLIGDDEGDAIDHLGDMQTVVGKFSTTPHLRLMWGSNSYPVIIANFTQSKWSHGEPVYVIGFDWWQTGDFDVPISHEEADQ